MTETSPTQPDPAASVDMHRFARTAAQSAASAGAVATAELALQLASAQESLHVQAEQLKSLRQTVAELEGDLAGREAAIEAKDAELARMAQVNHQLQQRVAATTPDEDVAVDQPAGTSPEEAAGEG